MSHSYRDKISYCKALDSAIHYTSSNISVDSILDCTKKSSGQPCEAVIKRDHDIYSDGKGEDTEWRLDCRR